MGKPYQSCVRRLNNEKLGDDYTGILCNSIETFINLKLFFGSCSLTAFSEMGIISDVLLFAHNCFLPIPCSFCLRYFYNGFVVKLARWWPCHAFIWEALPLAADLSYIFACWVCTSVRQTVVWAYTSVCQPTFSLLLLLGRSLLSWICFGVCLFVLRQSLTV